MKYPDVAVPTFIALVCGGATPRNTRGRGSRSLQPVNSATAALHRRDENVFGVRAGDVFWTDSHPGWVMGHSITVYGPLPPARRPLRGLSG
ncbi:hypothetical protein ACFW7J_37735 [Streptomyces sp. NPDC059525]|uniref:hypothetical protein n=1 Tax=Streptomyces sp. NPDC059525 TaxID=3346857 RepID=UPI003699973A